MRAALETCRLPKNIDDDIILSRATFRICKSYSIGLRALCRRNYDTISSLTSAPSIGTASTKMKSKQ
ncbi:MAG: hypothetical protein IPO48_21085 [Saprospiraceae bacterium]|nr:hypothetical protein [Saprospiraceae bacterium]